MPGRILVIRGGAIGDFLLTLPAMSLLRDGFPDSHIEILGYRRTTCLVDGRHYANATRTIDYGPLAGFFNPRSELDAGLCEYFSGFDQVVSYIYDPDRLFETSLRLAGVKNLISADPRVDGSTHAAFSLARPLESLALWLDDASAHVFPNDADRFAADLALAGLEPPIVTLHPGSGSERKNWPLECWLDLARRLADRPVRIVVISGEADGNAAESLLDRTPTARALADKPLTTLAAVFERSALHLGHDTGISHLAAAAGARCLLLFGPTDPAVWAPTNPGVSVLAAPDGNLASLDVEAVIAQVDTILSHAA